MKISTLLAGVALATGLGATAQAMERRFGHVGERRARLAEAMDADADFLVP